MRFAAPWDGTLKVTTALALALLGGGAILLAAAVPLPGATGALILAIAAATILLSWGLAPRGYAVEAGALRVERPLRSVSIPLAAVRAARRLPDEAFRGSARVMGSGGLFGYYGRFWNRRLGSFRLLATRRQDLVLVDTDDERFVLSPETPDRFLDALLSRTSAAARQEAGAPFVPRRTPRRVWLGVGALVVSVPLAVGAALLAAWGWAPRGVSLEGDAVRIERRLAGPVVIPLSDVRAVGVLPAESARALRRVSGASFPSGVRFGHFRSRELGDVRLYAWRDGPAVRLDTRDERIVLTPDDAEAFVADVGAVLAGRR